MVRHAIQSVLVHGPGAGPFQIDPLPVIKFNADHRKKTYTVLYAVMPKISAEVRCRRLCDPKAAHVLAVRNVLALNATLNVDSSGISLPGLSATSVAPDVVLVGVVIEIHAALVVVDVLAVVFRGLSPFLQRPLLLS